MPLVEVEYLEVRALAGQLLVADGVDVELVARDVLVLRPSVDLKSTMAISSVSSRRIRSIRPSTVIPGATWTWICFSVNGSLEISSPCSSKIALDRLRSPAAELLASAG